MLLLALTSLLSLASSVSTSITGLHPLGSPSLALDCVKFIPLLCSSQDGVPGTALPLLKSTHALHTGNVKTRLIHRGLNLNKIIFRPN